MAPLIITSVILIFIIKVLYFKRITIFEYERGLKYSKGKFKKILNPGQYWIFTYSTSIRKVDIRPKFVSITGQEIISADSITLKISIAAKYEIIKPDIAVNHSENYQEAFYLILQLALREIIGLAKIDEVLEKRNLFGEKLMQLTTTKVEELGLKLLSVNIKDIMFPGELKKMFAQVVKARKEGLAALEKTRGETAALRNLVNAAKMIENNPNLMQLRLLQLIGESSGNTVVLGSSPVVAPLPVKNKKIGKSKIEKLKKAKKEEE